MAAKVCGRIEFQKRRSKKSVSLSLFFFLSLTILWRAVVSQLALEMLGQAAARYVNIAIESSRSPRTWRRARVAPRHSKAAFFQFGGVVFRTKASSSLLSPTNASTTTPRSASRASFLPRRFHGRKEEIDETTSDFL